MERTLSGRGAGQGSASSSLGSPDSKKGVPPPPPSPLHPPIFPPAKYSHPREGVLLAAPFWLPGSRESGLFSCSQMNECSAQRAEHPSSPTWSCVLWDQLALLFHRASQDCPCHTRLSSPQPLLLPPAAYHGAIVPFFQSFLPALQMVILASL